MLDAIITIDHQGHILEWNPAAEQLFGYSRAEVLGREIANLIIPPSLREQHRQGLSRYIATGEQQVLGRRIELTALRAGGTEFPVELAITRIPLDGAPMFTGFVRDITERKRAEEELRQLLAREQAARAEAEMANARLKHLLTITDTALAHLTFDDLLHELLARIHEIMRVENSAISLVTEDGQSLRVCAALGQEVASQVQVPIGQGFAGRIAAQREPLIMEDPSSVDIVTPLLRERLRSLAGVPLCIGERLLGVMHIGSIAPRHFTPDDVQFLQQVADRMALAIEHARLYEAEQQVRAEATLRASQLEAIFEAVTDGLYVYDTEGHLLHMNQTARQMLGFDTPADYAGYAARPFAERATSLFPRDEQGQPLRQEDLPGRRLLRGKVLAGATSQDVLLHTLAGEEIHLNFSGRPMRDQSGHIVGAVAIGRDVKERRRLERRNHEALDALLVMAEALVDIPAEAPASGGQAPGAVSEVAQRLVELASQVLGCHRLSITAIEPGTELLRLVAMHGFSHEQEQQVWKEQQQRQMRLADSPDQALISRLRAKEVLQFDMTQPPWRDQPNPYGVRTMLIVPMSIEDRIVGFLFLDHAGEAHDYSAQECALAQAVAHFAALVLERQRLLHEQRLPMHENWRCARPTSAWTRF